MNESINQSIKIRQYVKELQTYMLVDKFCQKKTIATLDNKTNELNRTDILYFMLACFRQKYIQIINHTK